MKSTLITKLTRTYHTTLSAALVFSTIFFLVALPVTWHGHLTRGHIQSCNEIATEDIYHAVAATAAHWWGQRALGTITLMTWLLAGMNVCGKKKEKKIQSLLFSHSTPTTHQTPTARFVAFWWTQYCITQTGILYMGIGVPIPVTSNSWVVVLLHGVGLWWIQEGS